MRRSAPARCRSKLCPPYSVKSKRCSSSTIANMWSLRLRRWPRQSSADCPDISILASSREPLAIAGETVYRMPSLSFPQRTDGITADEALSYSAVQLFAERGRAAVNGFVVANDNAPCGRRDLQAARRNRARDRVGRAAAEDAEANELANRLDDQFRILTGGSRTALPRQQTLRALIDWSYNLLSEPERILLRRLSVFAGGCTMDGAAAVAADYQLQQSDIFDLMASLVDKSLVVADASGQATRYRLLESTRQYAAEKLKDAGETGWHRRLAQYLVTYYGKSVEEWPTAPTNAWIENYSPELDNLRASFEWAFGNEGDVINWTRPRWVFNAPSVRSRSLSRVDQVGRRCAGAH